MTPDVPTPPRPGVEARSAAMDDLTDEELDRYVETRLRIIGVDLSVLPDDDADAPADRVRVLRSARSFLRRTVPALSAFDLDPQVYPPVSYPAALPAVPEAGQVPEAGHGG